MNVAVIDRREALSDYIVEMLRAWGLMGIDKVDAPDASRHDVVIVPASEDVDAEALMAFARQGACVIALMPRGALAAAIGLGAVVEKRLPAYLRMNGFSPSGWAGELFPIVGRAYTHERIDPSVVLGYLCYIDQFTDETPGVIDTPVGDGRVISLAFDLPTSVMLMRQGDPAYTEQIPEGDGCARPSHLASRFIAGDAGWIPHADLLARLLLDLAIAHRAAPTPLMDHLPDARQAIMLYSGDEDVSDVSATDEELEFLTAHGARMDLYIIPNATQSTPEDVRRFATHHDVGPHPNLRSLDGTPVTDRLAEMVRQIKLFEDTWGVKARTTRNHCTAWVGYTDLVETMEACGVRMEANYTSSGYMRERNHAPYAPFGGAMPMRYCRADGRLVNVFQQHTHVMDDVWFAPDHGATRKSTYSFRFTAESFSPILNRILDDTMTRFHTPLTTCIHPGNWVRYSREQGRALVVEAVRRHMPVWSITQWSRFWDKRDTWTCSDVTWHNHELTCTFAGSDSNDSLHAQLPARFHDLTLQGVVIDGQSAKPVMTTRHGRPTALVSLKGRTSATITGQYH